MTSNIPPNSETTTKCDRCNATIQKHRSFKLHGEFYCHKSCGVWNEPKSVPKTDKPRRKVTLPELWQTAPSLRPDPERLVLASEAGDEESEALIEALRFTTNRATRIITHTKDGKPILGLGWQDEAVTWNPLNRVYLEKSSDLAKLELSTDGMVGALADAMDKDLAEMTEADPVKMKLAESGQDVTCFEEDQNASVLALGERIGRDEAKRSKAHQGSPDRFAYLASAPLSGDEKEKHIELILERGMMRPHRADHRDFIMEILCHFSIYRCNHGYKQKSLRDRGLHLDTAIDFMTHIMEQIDAGKFTPNGEAGSFYRWTNKCFRRFANTALTELTKENRRFVQMENPRTDSDEEGKPTAADKEAYTLWSKSSANQHIDGALSVLSPEDRAYAGLLKLGFAQKKAAEVMEESVPTSRIREKKIRDVIQKTIPIIQAFADEDNLLGWPKAEENSFSISACATETQARFLSPDEAAIYLGGLNSRTLTRWAREGYIPAIPIGEGKRRLWRFLESDLEGWMLARRQGGQNAA